MIVASSFATKVLAQSDIPPNYGAYELNLLYDSTATLGWAKERIEEKLGRGLVAVRATRDVVYLSWRLLKDDPPNVAFNIYRTSESGEPIRLNPKPLQQTTDFTDKSVSFAVDNDWWVTAVIGEKESASSARVTLPAGAPVQNYLSIRLRDDIKERGVHKVGIGDLDGDGEYDFVVKRPYGMTDPGRVRKSVSTFKVEGYTSKGAFLWRNDLGWSIEQGTWYSPMIVYDLDGDGIAEVALKTGDGDPRQEDGRVLSGPEYCSVWNGESGAEIAKVDWIPRGESRDWGDNSHNRQNRNMLGVAYLDGVTPSLLVLRGIYGLMKMDAWFLQEGQLHRAWSWTNARAGWKYQGQGQHTIHVADIDGDGRDEILNGSIAIDHDGRILWSTGLGHGDRFYISDIDPQRPGLEAWYSYEDPHPQNGVSLWDAATGDLIFGARQETGDDQVDVALVSDIDPSYPGMECWATGFFFTAQGQPIAGEIPPLNGLVWWDADPLRELHDRGRIFKWQGATLTEGIQGQVMVWADIIGDWREEIVTHTNGELRIYTTTIPAQDRRVCLMQDPLYRLDVALKAMGYDQVPMTSYFLGDTGDR
ncbi:silent information regulator protein Sir2 [candidate division KSB1 bacterium]|nr:silent information regulator protein Sir2 [candidate division KSB1 bacterium]